MAREAKAIAGRNSKVRGFIVVIFGTSQRKEPWGARFVPEFS
jgi:hypothetical protein